MVIGNIEMRREFDELKDAVAAGQAPEGPSGESAVSLDKIIARLQTIASDLKAVREGK